MLLGRVQEQLWRERKLKEDRKMVDTNEDLKVMAKGEEEAEGVEKDGGEGAGAGGKKGGKRGRKKKGGAAGGGGEDGERDSKRRKSG